MKKEILGVKIDDLSIPEIVSIVEGWLKKEGKHYIVTPNPEIVMMAQKDLELKKILNNTDLSIPDGVGLKLASDIENISPGVDVLEALVKLAADLGATVGFLGGRVGVAEKAVERLLKKHPNLKVTFAGSGGEVDEEGNSIEYRVSSIKGNKQKNKSHYTLYTIPATDLLFVAFGPPKQEKWIAKNLKEIDVKVAMGVGGAFDYLSGRVKRAPKLIRSLGLEWLFRLIIQPWRIKRQIALLKYLYLVIH
ncbi:WecB/TagA/CpsF family glycosyltransferase [Candidatus Daviesbacteria bacterium]|nr:WecB/TagA/CpsF family glycosyltransferase [Candidatus Daviesbacteria bacterium]